MRSDMQDAFCIVCSTSTVRVLQCLFISYTSFIIHKHIVPYEVQSNKGSLLQVNFYISDM
jgi:hypothetical protein